MQGPTRCASLNPEANRQQKPCGSAADERRGILVVDRDVFCRLFDGTSVGTPCAAALSELRKFGLSTTTDIMNGS
jgi:hypothetical protein